MASHSDPANSSPPLVSVAMTAYNSEKWLARAIDSVLLQQTDFPVEIIVGDDCSTDGTLAVARACEKQHPSVVRVLERSKNLGMQRNFYDTFEHCRGKYIAWLDADDYWTDPEKLALQVQIMESEASVSVCGHFVRWISDEGNVIRKQFPIMSSGRYGLKDIILRNFVPSPSILFRNGIHRELPSWFFDLTGLADWPLLVLAARSGDIVLLDRTMADYMLTAGSAYMGKGPLQRDILDLEFYERMETMLHPKWHRHVRAALGKQYEAIAYHLGQQGDYAASRQAALKALRSPAWSDNCTSKCRTALVAIAREAVSKLRPTS
jgi:glycosyltransferase involved in cell wall biosynthesis